MLPNSKEIPEPVYPIIGIGASAGGLEALQLFFAHVDPRFEAAYVVVQHLSPDFESKMDELLARKVALPIAVVQDGMTIEPGRIYLMPPRAEMVISSGKLRLIQVETRDHLTLPIDHFFKSLAQEAGTRAVAIVMSGTGSDGSRGVVDVHEAGGFVLAQSPETAKFSGMPSAAMATGAVDLEIDPQEMPTAIAKRLPTDATYQRSLVDEDHYDEATLHLLHLLREMFGVDFSQYNPSTILRRINRRMALDGFERPADYLGSLEGHPDRIAGLYRDLLIGVSSFFRDPEAMEELRSTAVAAILESAQPAEEIRIWVEGCATGQEAYTLAIIFLEAIRTANKNCRFKVFATDLHRDSLEIASRGIYSEKDLQPIESDLRERYFEKHENDFRVRDNVRSCIVFAQHNALSSPPFTRMDLISCRNMLIYLKPAAKKKVLSLFNFGLKRRGYLFLGSSESLAGLEKEFETVSKRSKVYRKLEVSRIPAYPIGGENFASMAGFQASSQSLASNWDMRGSQSKLLRAYEQLLNRFMPCSLLIDSDGSLIHSFDGAEEFIRIRGGRFAAQIPDCLIPALRRPVANLLRCAKQEKGPVAMRAVAIDDEPQSKLVEIRVEPMPEKRSDSSRYFITFSPQEPKAIAEPEARLHSSHSHEQIKYLEDELTSAQESLQSAVEELEASNEELQATNEELIASNEELQSSNEELQSVNEELQTVNSEHQQKIIELSDVTADLENLLSASELGVFFLDADLQLKRFTPLVAELFHLSPNDQNRRLQDFHSQLDYQDLQADLREACRHRKIIEKQISDKRGVWYLFRIIPFFQEYALQGVIGTLVDITSVRKAEETIVNLSAVVAQSEDAIFTLSPEGIVQSWNRGAQILFHYSSDEAVGQDIRNLVAPDQSIRDEIGNYLADLIQGRPVAPFDSVRKTKEGDIVHVSVRFSPLLDPSGTIVGASLIDRDITALMRTREALRRKESDSRLILESVSEGIILIDGAGRCVTANPSALQMLGKLQADQVDNRPIEEAFASHDPSASLDILGIIKRVRKDGETVSTQRVALKQADGSNKWIELWCRPVAGQAGEGGLVLTMLDVTSRVAAEEDRDWLSTLVAASADLISTAGTDGTVRFINHGGLKMLGLKADADISTMKIADFHPPESLKQIREIGMPAAVERGHWSGMTTLLDAQKREIPISQSIFAHKNSEGETYAYSTICRDLSDRVAYETALRKSEDASRRAAAKLSSVVENIPDLLLMVNADLKIDFASQNTRALFKALGGAKLIPPPIETLAREVIASGKPYVATDYKGVVEFKFGSQHRYFLPRIQPNYADGSLESVVGATILLQDVTEFRLLDDVKSNLLGTVSHELKTPVTSIRMALMLLLEEKDKLEETQALLVETASEETERMLRTLNILLDLTRFEEGKRRLELSVLAPSTLVEETLSGYARAIELGNLAVKVDAPAKLPAIEVDVQHMRHALGNLIGNAIKHSPPKGEIDIAVRQTSTGKLRFSVRDRGEGVPEAFAAKVFDRFYKLPGNSKPGTGLGLSIAREFVLAHGGAIGVENHSEGGAEFFFEIPPKPTANGQHS